MIIKDVWTGVLPEVRNGNERIISSMRSAHAGLNRTLLRIGKHAAGRWSCLKCETLEVISHYILFEQYEAERRNLE